MLLDSGATENLAHPLFVKILGIRTKDSQQTWEGLKRR